MFLRKSLTPVYAKVAIGMAAMMAVLAPALAHAQEVEYLTQSNANILWTLVAAFLVMLMQAGFGCVEAGFTRAKSAGNIMMKNFLDFSVGSICFFLFGFALMFGIDAGGFMGTSGYALSGVGEADLPWSYTFWFFQSVFAATAATIVSGGMAERTKFGSYVLVSIVVTGIIYPISGHWAWGSLWLGDDGAGWLEGLGFVDFAGSSVVHSVGGWIALAGALVLGPRVGKYTEDGKAKAIPGHNIPLAALGVFLLWFGWFGFNPGSTTTADDTIGLIAMNTSLAACAGVLGAMCISWFRFGKPDISMTLNGALAGLVGITAGCATVSPGSSIVIGLIAGLLVVLSIEFIDKVLRIDDPVGAASVHGVCGAWGTIACGLFNTDGGLLFGGGFAQLGVQLIGVGVFFAWAFGAGFILMTVIKGVFGLRVEKEEELKGLDIAEHGSESYSGFQLFSNE
ncbi:MAG: ammonium transporter [Pseudodesulfovibrio sp.]|uniref:Ammonium transporter n=1 Tax=Pseudodesulfovibrio aespoeensis (strain ATCC 700646 / DSM 10631 / Aspo-2) TaxID=643562 RepID=E6VSI9_PSEA9|nr:MULTISPECIES: ammonium transporter [Pseudodesulfovibrio]MBU4193249.1 ammonium transporter [Pseudomonadota bacterium]ADU61974.1 ammonium transporter [Pseudodesulfovibrio aespoeensis Aspo-2]MBU4378702.1 ammonium transporter [Pseudomonadota bacterium]MBU4476303.1 ammonium transporter [Pseudomonadota bacterium]MBU4516056.1 ammonium transporter [Pseudomonadota bacterium]